MKEELIKFTPEELARRMVGYIDATDSLIMRAEYFMGGVCPEKELEQIRKDYKKLKASIRADAQYAVHNKHSALGCAVYESRFMPSVTQAAAWGYDAPDDCFADKTLVACLKAGRKKLTAEFSEDYWRILAQ